MASARRRAQQGQCAAAAHKGVENVFASGIVANPTTCGAEVEEEPWVTALLRHGYEEFKAKLARVVHRGKRRRRAAARCTPSAVAPVDGCEGDAGKGLADSRVNILQVLEE